MARLLQLAGLGLALWMTTGTPAFADDSWNPFKDRDQARKAGRPARADSSTSAGLSGAGTLPPTAGVGSATGAEPGHPEERLSTSPDRMSFEQPSPWAQPRPRDAPGPDANPVADAVQRSELQPVVGAKPTSQAPDLWRGLDAASLQATLAPLAIPPGSGALAALWQRLWSTANGSLSNSTSPSGTASPTTLDAIRIEALHRSGLIADLAKAVRQASADSADPVMGLLVARTHLTLGERAEGCSAIKALQHHQSKLPKSARDQFLVLAGLCGAGNRDAGTAGLAADLLRAEGVEAPVPLAALDAIAANATDAFELPKVRSISLLDYRFIELTGGARTQKLVPAAEPALLSMLATTSVDPETRILAAEAAVALHAITAADLAAAYRAASFSPSALAQPLSEHQAPPLKRALLFKALESERTPIRKARLVRALLDEVRRAHGPYMPTASALAPLIADLHPAQEIGWFAETAIEINLAALRLGSLLAWTEPPFGERYGGLKHWLVLADIADPQWRGRRGEHLPAAEQFAVRGKLAPELMHRLVTVLDALDYQIPIPLWEAASRSPQPTTGHLPETGVLSELQEASRRQEGGRVVLTAIRTLGPDSGDTAHMIALGDTIRGLKRAGFEADARKLGLEALFNGWPRSSND